MEDLSVSHWEHRVECLSDLSHTKLSLLHVAVASE